MNAIAELTGLDILTIGSIIINIILIILVVVMASEMVSDKSKKTEINKSPLISERRKNITTSANYEDTRIEIHTSCRGFQYSMIYDSTGKLLYYGDNNGRSVCYI